MIPVGVVEAGEGGGRFSIGDAAVDGFRQLRQHWRLAVGWSVFLLLGMLATVIVAVVLAVLLTLGGVLAAPTAGALVGGAAASVISLMLGVMLQAAIWRLLLQPRQPAGFFRLHVGRDELKLFGLSLLVIAGLVLFLLPAVIARNTIPPAPLGVTLLLGLVMLGLYAWLLLRMAFVFPLVIERQPQVFRRSWRLTRGRTLPLLGLAILVAVFIVLLWVVETLALGAGALLTMGWPGLMAVISPNPGDAGHATFSLVQGLVQLLLYPVLMLIWQAPFAAAYRAFAAEAETAV